MELNNFLPQEVSVTIARHSLTWRKILMIHLYILGKSNGVLHTCSLKSDDIYANVWWWDEWDETALWTQDAKFEPWWSEAEQATSRSPQYLIFKW